MVIVDNIVKDYGDLRAVDGVSFDVRQGETLGVVGESGCGKSTAGRSLLRLVEPQSGEVHLDGKDIMALGSNDLRAARLDMQMIFQDPFSSFHPTYTIFEQIKDVVNRDFKDEVDIEIFLKSGPARVTSVDGTTEWNVTISPQPSYDLVTYAYSGTGTAPGLGTIVTGDYVSIITTGEFLPENQGGYRVDSATASSFTIRRPTGVATEQSDVATL